MSEFIVFSVLLCTCLFILVRTIITTLRDSKQVVETMEARQRRIHDIMKMQLERPKETLSDRFRQNPPMWGKSAPIQLNRVAGTFQTGLFSLLHQIWLL